MEAESEPPCGDRGGVVEGLRRRGGDIALAEVMQRYLQM
jgi:hypothetical protein